MTSLLSAYWGPEHGRREDLDYFAALQPADICILQPDVQHVSDAHRASPESLITLRRWDWDDNRSDGNPEGVYKWLREDPEGLAAWMVNQYAVLIGEQEAEAKRRGIPYPAREQICVHLVNEPDSNNLLPQINRFTVEAVRRSAGRGFLLDCLDFSTGHPAILNAHGEPDWEPVAPALDAITRGGHFAVVHEYCNDLPMNDPSVYPWHIGRHAKWAPRGPRWKIGEFNLEMILNQRMPNHHGWQGIIAPEEMAWRTDTYLAGTRDDVEAVRWYMTDFRDKTWATFDSLPLHSRLVDIGRRYPAKRAIPSIPSGKPRPNIFLPSVPNSQAARRSSPVSTGSAAPLPDTLDPLALEALIAVESAGNTHGADGRLLIRFEAHIFRAQYGNDAIWAQHFQTDPDKPWVNQMWRRWPSDTWLPIHTGKQDSEWAAFEFAAGMSRTPALLSISMGAPQIMGFNHRRIGYQTPGAMFDAFQRSANAQVVGLLNFIWSNDDLAIAINAHDWRTVAMLYNGSGNVDHYAGLMAAAYTKLAEWGQ